MRSTSPERSANNFGALRLLFAVLVILSHSYELVDGDRSREPFTRLFGTLSLGEFAVYGFFLISGYLITKSFVESRSVLEYLYKRILRIYPAYIVAFLVCTGIVAPLAGGQLSGLSGGTALAETILLVPPIVPGAFADTPFPLLNGSMWTIAYEFRCYLLVLLLGTMGLFAKRAAILAGTAAILVGSAFAPGLDDGFPEPLILVVGVPATMLSFIGIFGAGSLFYLYRGRIRYGTPAALVSALALCGGLFVPALADAAVAVFGGYLLFRVAFDARWRWLATVGRHTDISYGTYLYAWPVQKLLLFWQPGLGPLVVFAASTLAAALLGFLSWKAVEKPLLNLKTAFVPAPVATRD